MKKFPEPLPRSLRSRGYQEVIFEVAEAKFWISSNFNGFSFRIFVILSFEVFWPQRPRRPQKGLREFFQKLHFWNQCVPTKKMRYVTALWSKFSLNLFTEEVWPGIVRYAERNGNWKGFWCWYIINNILVAFYIWVTSLLWFVFLQICAVIIEKVVMFIWLILTPYFVLGFW